MIGTFMDSLSKEEECKLANWSKEEVYEAYMSEYIARVNLNKEVKRLNRRLTEIRYIVSGIKSE